eukprot:TRINITY_DN1804_c0_g1_i1.p1 TRINITY_DN1804_c0_g1~~TRINITY_DN1804_c0_g1_i1.p1  ORF type:complete len:249 (-),score=81.24 TRINITY_DN1804_c0_g1_i1:99-845(-)
MGESGGPGGPGLTEADAAATHAEAVGFMEGIAALMGDNVDDSWFSDIYAQCHRWLSRIRILEQETEDLRLAAQIQAQQLEEQGDAIRAQRDEAVRGNVDTAKFAAEEQLAAAEEEGFARGKRAADEALGEVAMLRFEITQRDERIAELESEGRRLAQAAAEAAAASIAAADAAEDRDGRDGGPPRRNSGYAEDGDANGAVGGFVFDNDGMGGGRGYPAMPVPDTSHSLEPLATRLPPRPLGNSGFGGQ